jgi:hypothetical protein
MTGPEHWSEADLILTGERCEYGCPHSGCEHEMSLIARAQVHAILALAAATVAGSRMNPLDRDEWERATDPESYQEWAAEGQAPAMPDDPDEPANRDIEPELDDFVQDRHADLDPAADEAEPEPADWHDGPDPADYDPGPEADDEGGMSEYRGWLP